MQKSLILVLILAIIIGIFAISNNALVPINFIFTEVLLSQAIVIFSCVLLGAILASVFGGIRQMSLKKDIRHLKSEKEAEKNTMQSEIYRLEGIIRDKDDYIEAKEIKDTIKLVDNNITNDSRSDKNILDKGTEDSLF